VAFGFQPRLLGTLVELRPLRAEDAEELFRVASDPMIWEQHPARDRYKPEVFVEFFLGALASGGALTAIDLVDGKIIGSSRFHGYDAEVSEVEIGWTFLARSHWGGRYNGEMKRLMVAHALNFVHRVVFLIGTGNVRSQRAIERLGGVRAGTRLDAAGRESYVYEMTSAPGAEAG
jgi:RimJ/RimL family protein N-acetyltransferase